MTREQDAVALGGRVWLTELTRRGLRAVGVGGSSGWLTIGLLIVGGILLASIFAEWLPLSDPYAVDYGARLIPPSWLHPLGTDNLGRDMLSRVIYGARIDLTLGFTVVVLSMAVGIVLGMIAGLQGGWAEVAIMRSVDAFLSIPFILLALAVVAIIGPGLLGVYVGMTVVSWTIYARITFSQMLVLRESQFILAARTLGFSTPRIIFRHMLPSLLRPNISFAISDVVYNILGLASLSYLGVGIQPPAPEWGALISSGRDFLLTAWWISVLPGVAVVIVGVGFSLVGEGVAERLDVSSVHRR